MRMVRYAILIILNILWISGCVGMSDSEGWRERQKETFLALLKDDPYLSMCGLESLYKEVEESRDSHLMTKLLLGYMNNLANSCIDIAAFEQAQEARKSDEFKTEYEIYRQEIDPLKVRMQLKADLPFNEMFQTYIPQYREWYRLLHFYRTLQKREIQNTKLLYKVRLNIERIKLMKPLTLPYYVLVNIPEFTVRLIENNQTAVKMKVVIGKRQMQTPVFSEYLKYIVVNPQWNVPDSIAKKEIVPKALEDPDYLAAHNLEVRKDYNLDSPKLDFSLLWDEAYLQCDEKLPFKFIEPPSVHNGLGRVKFLFPNRYSVYMHDTQSKYLFKRKVRTYSHGCIRLAQPNLLLEYIVSHYSQVPWEKAKEMYESFKTHYITLTKPLPVHTAYLTAYVEDNGTIKIFNDIYGYDAIQKLK